MPLFTPRGFCRYDLLCVGESHTALPLSLNREKLNRTIAEKGLGVNNVITLDRWTLQVAFYSVKIKSRFSRADPVARRHPELMSE